MMRTNTAGMAISIVAAITLSAHASDYQHDAGNNVGQVYLAGGGHALMMNRYAAMPGLTQVTAIEFPWHNAPGAQAQVIIWSDPDNDGLPNNDAVLWSTTINGSGGDAGEIEFVQISVPQIDVGPAGSNFFIGFSELTPLLHLQAFTTISNDPGAFVPERGFGLVDFNHPIIPTELDGIMPIENLVSIAPKPTPTLMIRAQAIPAPGAPGAMIGLGILASRRRR